MSATSSMLAEESLPPSGDMGMVVRSTCSDMVGGELCTAG